MKTPKYLVGIIFDIPCTDKQIDREEKIMDKMMKLPYVQSVNFGVGACPCFIVEVVLENAKDKSFEQIQKELMNCKQ